MSALPFAARANSYDEHVAVLLVALASGPETTPELAVYVAKAKGLDAGDAIMRRMIGMKLIHTLRIREKQGQLVMDGKRKGRSMWRLAADKTLL